jgi:hypothetical protein
MISQDDGIKVPIIIPGVYLKCVALVLIRPTNNAPKK